MILPPVSTTSRKARAKTLASAVGNEAMGGLLADVLLRGKEAYDEALYDLGTILAEAVMYIERDEIAGPEYQPSSRFLRKWAAQPGSVYIGDQKRRVMHPRLRGPVGEVELQSYAKMKDKGAFSEELLAQSLRGMSTRKYHETVVGAAEAFGVSKSTASERIVEATAAKLKAFQERDLSKIEPFAVFIDTIHRGKVAFIVALCIDLSGEKTVLGFWEGATENSEICQALLSGLEGRGLSLPQSTLWITDGGSGVCKALRDRYGKKLVHQRCTIHKDRNIQRHLPKRYRAEAHHRFKRAITMNDYDKAKDELEDFEVWLRHLNASAADSLLEAFEEILTVHRLCVPPLLRKALHSTNGIESLFSTVRSAEGNVKRWRNSAMRQRWLATVCLHAEKRFKRVKGFKDIATVMKMIACDQLEKRAVG